MLAKIVSISSDIIIVIRVKEKKYHINFGIGNKFKARHFLMLEENISLG